MSFWTPRVEEVTYVLHPSFRDRVKVVHDRGSHLALSARGWGEFMIGVTIQKKSGETL